MKIKFNPLGTHVKDFLRVGIDFYPEWNDNAHNETYPIHYVQVPVFPSKGYPRDKDKFGNPIDLDAYNEWVNSLDKIWQLNPCLRTFLTISETETLTDVREFISKTFNKDVVATIDDIMVQPDNGHLISPYMRGKGILSNQVVQTKDIADLISSVNDRLKDLSLSVSDGDELTSSSESIDVGPSAIDRGFDAVVTARTTIDRGNPANATGSIDTFKTWLAAAVTQGYGCIFHGSEAAWTCRDWEDVGSLSAGSEQTVTGLDIDVVTDDTIGFYASYESPAGKVELDASGGAGVLQLSSDERESGEQTYNIYGADDAVSFYGTGTESGAGWSTIKGVSGVLEAAIKDVKGVAKADIKNVKGVAV